MIRKEDESDVLLKVTEAAEELIKVINCSFHTFYEVRLSSFHLNGYTFGFHPQTRKLEPPCMAK